jgi:putative PEP-CTERM system histidine kinase
MRWHIKFMLLGLGALFAVEIYISSQALLFSSINTTLTPVSSVTLLVASALIFISFWRSRLIHVEVYLSRTLLHNSLTVLIVGIYLLVVGFLAQAVTERGGVESLPLAALLVFVAILALVTTLLSDGVRQRFRRFVSRHLRRPEYDYRNVWSGFTEKTRAALDIRELCLAVARLVSETLRTPSVTLWLLNETRDGVVMGGSTAFSHQKGEEILAPPGRGGQLIGALEGQSQPIDLKSSPAIANRFREEAQMRYGVSLVAGQEPVGYLTLDEKVGGEDLSTEDFILLKTIADQAASTLLNVRLSERLLRAKELEAFQTLSAFFIHDLKNLASRLSLSLQNLPLHYDNPDFRKDLLKVISQSVDKINSMCGRLSPLSRDLELHPEETDLNSLVTETLESLNGSTKARLIQDLRPVPLLQLDSEQIQKVLVNLVLNASEATGGLGNIRVATRKRSGWTEITVSDDGPGMSREFVERFLFKPFHTTKKQGLGIGLFHCKKIVDAHDGRIEVETQEGKGSTFRVLFPNS